MVSNDQEWNQSKSERCVVQNNDGGARNNIIFCFKTEQAVIVGTKSVDLLLETFIRYEKKSKL